MRDFQQEADKQRSQLQLKKKKGSSDKLIDGLWALLIWVRASTHQYVQMDGEGDSSEWTVRQGLEDEWRGSRHQGSAATLVFKQDAQEGNQVPARCELPEAVCLYVGQGMTHDLHSSQ